MTTTTNLLITHIESSQAQKEVTANEAFDRLDAAIAGRLALSTTGGTTTLTDAQASNAILDVSGDLTSNAVIDVPARSKLYAVRNATTGAFTLTVKTESGTGVIVAQGSSAIVYCDGTNVTTATDAQMADHLAAPDPHPQYATDADLSAHTGAATGAHAASAISNTPAGNIAATTVQAAINELDSEKFAMADANTWIQGLTLLWVSGSALDVSTGSAWVPSLNKILQVTTKISLTGLSFAASTWYHLYLYDNAGTPLYWRAS